jgi:hypothetical protein
MLLIGSGIVNYHKKPNLLNREAMDIDLVGAWYEWLYLQKSLRNSLDSAYAEPSGNKMIATLRLDDHGGRRAIRLEFEIAWPGSLNEELIALVSKNPLTQKSVTEYFQYNPFSYDVPHLNVLFALKHTHRFVGGPHFRKTESDYRILRNHGCKIPEYLKEWVEKREKETYSRVKYPSLNRSKQEFFKGDGIKYVYDHDSIHQVVAYGDQPAYTLFRKDDEPVAVDREKFFKLNHLQQIQSVAEEAMVLAIERSIVPYVASSWTPREAFQFALDKICTTISSGWWRQFAFDNYPGVLQLCPADFADKFWNAVSVGKVKSYKGSTY